MKKLLSYSLAAVGAILIQSTAFAQLLVTEINSSSQYDFFEVTNFGSISIDLSNGSWDDDSFIAGTVVIPSGISIAPGESIIFLADTGSAVSSEAAAAAFRSSWNINSSVQVVATLNAVGLGNGDGVRLFDSANQSLATLSYAAGGFTRSNGTLNTAGHAGVAAGGVATQSLIWDPTSGTTPATARYTNATGSNFGSFASGGSGVGSPGVAAVPEPSAFALMGAGLSALVILARRRRAAN